MKKVSFSVRFVYLPVLHEAYETQDSNPSEHEYSSFSLQPNTYHLKTVEMATLKFLSWACKLVFSSLVLLIQS